MHRLLFLHPSDELYGADRMLLEMVGALDSGVDVEVWLPTDLQHPTRALCHELASRGVSVRHLDLPIMRRAYQNPRGLASLLRKAVGLFRELRAVAPDAVYCTTSAAFVGAPVARLAQVPMVIGHLQEIWSSTDRRFVGVSAQSCHRLLAISGAVAASMPEALQRRTVVVPNGTPSPERVTPVALHDGRLQYLVASRWNGWKGHRTLLEAWELAGSPGHLVVLGAKPLSGDSVDVDVLVSRLLDPGSVSILGEVADPSPYLDSADVVIVPSDKPEPFGLVAIEAFARGRPVIASASGGLLDIVTPGLDGWLFPPGDPIALAELLATMSRDSISAHGRAARITYETRYTIATFRERWRQSIALDWVSKTSDSQGDSAGDRSAEPL